MLKFCSVGFVRRPVEINRIMKSLTASEYSMLCCDVRLSFIIICLLMSGHISPCNDSAAEVPVGVTGVEQGLPVSILPCEGMILEGINMDWIVWAVVGVKGGTIVLTDNSGFGLFQS